MSLETNFNVSPYFDDFDEEKQFYQVLFRPGVAVQTRELNQLQTILQNQIERFGNHVFKNGTIVSGCNFEYLTFYPYVKIKDVNTSNQPVDLATYSNYWVKNSSNLIAKVINYKTGVESRDPDLNTLYLRYLNGGSTKTATKFANSEALTVFSVDYPVFSVNVNNGGSNFSNSDSVVFLSALSVNVSSGTFQNAETVTQSTTGAQAQIVQVNATAIANTLVLKIKPLSVDLSNTSANSAEWTFTSGYNITGGTSGAVANVVSLVGSGAVGEIITDSQGIVQSVEVTSGGSNYVVPPYTTIKPVSNTAAVNTLNLDSQNYLTTITVANSSVTAPVGNGYAFGVTGGLIYQKGHFLKVNPQIVVVDKYSSAPNNAVVGFDTAESVITSISDTSLLDNATGAPNYAAPGANRLKLDPALVVLTKQEAEANNSFLPLVEFVEGNPYKENRVTVYNTLAKEFERRTHESAGDYVVDPFSVSSREMLISSSNTSPNTTHFQVVVDPGVGYVSGSRVETLRNTIINVPKATETRIREDQIVTASYGSYVLIKELVGSFNAASGGTVSLRDTAAQAVTSLSSFTISAPGAEIGTARIRSIQYNSGVVGSAEALYELYLFDISMNAGKNFRDVKSIYYNGAGSADAVADCNLELDATLNSNVALLKQATDKKLVFPTSFSALKVVNSASFTYRSTSESLTIDSNGAVTISLSTSGESFPYTPSANLSASQEEDVIIVPTANLQASANLSGSVVVTNNSVVGTSTSFINDLRVGDYIKVANTTANQVFRISSISNNTLATLSSNATTMNTITANVMLFFPAFRPLNFISRDSRYINISANSTVMYANLATSITGSGTTMLATYTVRSTAPQVTRSVYRDCFVKLRLANNAANTVGPWSLGVPDAIRLKNVYLGNSSVDATYPEVTKNFYIHNGQTDDSYKLSRLVKQNDSSLALQSSDYLLVKFDVLQHSAAGGYKTVSSFNIDDSKTLANSVNTINTLEIPEYNEIDLRNAIDFRPVVTATATVTNAAASATVNPSDTNSFDTTTKYFPVVDSVFEYNTEYYLARRDRVVVDRNGQFKVINGLSGTNALKAPAAPFETMSLGVLNVPPYPSIGAVTSNTITQIMTRLVGNDSGVTNKRNVKHIIQTDTTTPAKNMQPMQYSMRDIVNLENRIKALEYQTSFNSLENEINKINIPSSLDATLNRFKNGFFVDSFIDNVKVDESHKEFASYIDFERGELHPEEMHINMQLQFKRADATTNNAIVANNVLMLPYTEYTLVSQPKATGAVYSDGIRSQFVGEVVVEPAAFEVEAMLEQSIVFNLEHAQPTSNYGSCGRSIICTKLYELGLMPQHIYDADEKFGAMLRATDPDAYYGYIKWASIVVDWMNQKGPQFMFWIRDPQKRAEAQQELAIRWTRRIALPWAYHMAYIMGAHEKDNRAGRLIMKSGLAVSRLIGKLFKDKQQSKTKNTFIGLAMCGVFAAFYVMAGLKDKEI